MHFKDANTGLITGGGGSVFKTTNGGLNWYQIYLTPNNYGDFRKLSVINNQYCFVVEDAKRVYKSTNYGDSWDSVGYVTGANHTYSCRFSSLQTGWVGGSSSQIFKTTNGGATWLFQNVNTTNLGTVLSFLFYNELTGWAVGGNGNLLYTSSGGSTFINSNCTNMHSDFILNQNYPNPFNNETVISFSLPRKSNVHISIFDIIGREIKTLVNEFKKAGSYLVSFNGSELASGVYFYRIRAGDFVQTKRMILLK
jgi:photosystem II stability/assembly factor-like uncharacterized protein